MTENPPAPSHPPAKIAAGPSLGVPIHGYAFGLDVPALVAFLRRLADDVEAGRAIPSAVSLAERLDPEDFAHRRLEVEYAAKERP